MEPAYLITWKPSTENTDKGWPEENLQQLFDEVEANGYADEEWRFARRKGVNSGEKVYLLRQGRRGQALLGFGTVLKAPSGTDGAIVRFEHLVDPRSKVVLASSAELKAIPEGTKYWNTQSSGILLPEEIAQALGELAGRGSPIPDVYGSSNPDWTRDELILALDLYFREPSARGSKSHPACQELSDILNRLPIHTSQPRSSTFRNANGVGMKLSNFLRYDSSYVGKGLAAGSNAESEVWESFSSDKAKLTAAVKAILAGALALDKEGVVATIEDDGAEEGRVMTRLHKVRERNAAVVKKKKDRVLEQTGALKCEVCGFDFKLAYGDLGAGYAECHHGIPISALEPGKKTTLADLHIVCANCHRMLHKGKHWPSVDDVRKLAKVSYTFQ
jgi:5-methylcytosine-specific restriction enzyme A